VKEDQQKESVTCVGIIKMKVLPVVQRILDNLDELEGLIESCGLSEYNQHLAKSSFEKIRHKRGYADNPLMQVNGRLISFGKIEENK